MRSQRTFFQLGSMLDTGHIPCTQRQQQQQQQQRIESVDLFQWHRVNSIHITFIANELSHRSRSRCRRSPNSLALPRIQTIWFEFFFSFLRTTRRAQFVFLKTHSDGNMADVAATIEIPKYFIKIYDFIFFSCVQ